MHISLLLLLLLLFFHTICFFKVMISHFVYMGCGCCHTATIAVVAAKLHYYCYKILSFIHTILTLFACTSANPEKITNQVMNCCDDRFDLFICVISRFLEWRNALKEPTIYTLHLFFSTVCLPNHSRNSLDLTLARSIFFNVNEWSCCCTRARSFQMFAFTQFLRCFTIRS